MIYDEKHFPLSIVSLDLKGDISGNVQEVTVKTFCIYDIGHQFHHKKSPDNHVFCIRYQNLRYCYVVVKSNFVVKWRTWFPNYDFNDSRTPQDVLYSLKTSYAGILKHAEVIRVTDLLRCFRSYQIILCCTTSNYAKSCAWWMWRRNVFSYFKVKLLCFDGA